MKQSLYDIFDHFTPEDNTLPHLKEQPMNEKAISDQVFSKIGYHPIVKTKKKKSYRLFGIAAAVAILACGTITTAAVTGNMDLFFSTVSSSNLSESGIHLPVFLPAYQTALHRCKPIIAARMSLLQQQIRQLFPCLDFITITIR